MAYHGGITEDAFVDVEVWLDNPAVPSQSPTSTPTTGGSGGGVKEKVLKMSSLIDQADDSELLPPTNGELNKWHQTYVAIMGSQPDEAEEPSPNQLAALHKRVFTKVHRFRVYTPLGDGSFLQKDLPGPGSFQSSMPHAKRSYFECPGELRETHRKIGHAVAICLGADCCCG